MPDLLLLVNGQKYGGWQDVAVDLGMDRLAGAFNLAVADNTQGKPAELSIKPGDECRVLADGQQVIDGWVDAVSVNYTAEPPSHRIRIRGRDKTGDLVDCSHIGKHEWRNRTLDQIVTDLVEPFGIGLTIETDTGKVFEKFRVNAGDTVFALIERLCRMRAVLALSYGDGKLTITRAGARSASDVVALGDNIKTGAAEWSNFDRYSRYVVVGQSQGGANKKTTDYVNPKAQTEDSVVSRYRPLVITAEGQTTIGSAQDRARWEATVRAGRSRAMDYTVQGWTQADGTVWPVNGLVTVKDDFAGWQGQMLINAVTLSIDETAGSVAGLNLVHPDTYKLQPAPTRIKGPVDSGFDPNKDASREV